MSAAIRVVFCAGIFVILCSLHASAQTEPEGQATSEASPPTAAGGDETEYEVIRVPKRKKQAPRPFKADPQEVLPSFHGPVGLFRTTTTDVGPRNSLRFGLRSEFFHSSDFLIQNDENTRLQGGLVFGYTPSQYLEIFGALSASANKNCRPTCGSLIERGRQDPEVMKSFGDLTLGPKVRLPLSPGFELGFEGGLKFLSSVSGLSFSGSSTSVWFGPLLSIDLRRVSNAPIRFHMNANFMVDNSTNLSGLEMTTLMTREVSMFAYGMGKSRFRGALAIDAPLAQVIPEFPIQPFAEYHVEIVTEDADPAFARYMPPACGTGSGRVPCEDNRDQHYLTLGVRTRVYKGVTIDVGTDVALRNVGFPYGTPLPPYNLMLGLSYPLDPASLTTVVTRTVEKKVEVQTAPPPSEGQVAGMVKSTKVGTPIAGAIVAVVGRTQSRAATDPDGTFRTVPLPAGPIELEVSAPGFDSAKAETTIVPGQDVDIDVSLTPRPPTGNVRGRVADDLGRGLEATLKIIGPENVEAKTDPSGAYFTAVPVGTYFARAEATNYLNKEVQVEVVQGQDKTVDFVLRTRPANSSVGVTAEGILVKQPVSFKGKSADLDQASLHLLDEVADALVNHPEIKRMRVEAHWDNSLPKKKAEELTTRQANAVTAYLAAQGIPDSRVEAVGLGSTKPLAPNMGAKNKARNRRIEFKTLH